MNRRTALLLISATAVGGAGYASSTAISSAALPGAQPDASNQSADESLRKDLARLASRVNSEEGVPVFLGCVNLAVNNTLQKPPPVTLTALNAAVAAEFRQTAAAWERIQPNPPATDVAHVIEVLAYRDFSTGGTEQRS